MEQALCQISYKAWWENVGWVISTMGHHHHNGRDITLVSPHPCNAAVCHMAIFRPMVSHFSFLLCLCLLLGSVVVQCMHAFLPYPSQQATPSRLGTSSAHSCSHSGTFSEGEQLSEPPANMSSLLLSPGGSSKCSHSKSSTSTTARQSLLLYVILHCS